MGWWENESHSATMVREEAMVAEWNDGQLYVAASRVGRPQHLRFAVPRDEATGAFRTRNVVFREALGRSEGATLCQPCEPSFMTQPCGRTEVERCLLALCPLVHSAYTRACI